MKRNHFMLITAIIAWIFGLTMMFAPDKMMDNLTVETNTAVAIVMQWVGVGIFSIGCMNFISRNDAGSLGLKAVMSGNIILHAAGLMFDLFDYSNGFMKFSGLLMGIIVHVLLIIGFVYFLNKIPKLKSER
jgi:hypothetical protein